MIASSLACAKLVFGKTLRNKIQTALHVTANEAWHLSGLKQLQAAQGHTFMYKVKQHKVI